MTRKKLIELETTLRDRITHLDRTGDYSAEASDIRFLADVMLSILSHIIDKK